MNVDFDEWKNIHEAIIGATDAYEIKSFKPWVSDGNREYITIQLIKKE